MVCPKCKEHLVLDDVSNTYFCENCNRVYGADEVYEKGRTKILLLSFLIWIPIIGTIIFSLIKTDDTNAKMTYDNVFLSSLFAWLTIVLLTTGAYVYFRDTTIDNFISESRRSIESTIQKNDLIENLPLYTHSELPEPKPIEETVSEISEDEFGDELINVLDGGIINGSKVKYICSKYSGYSYLLQTTELRVKLQDFSTYVVLGYCVTGADYSPINEYAEITTDILTDTYRQLTSTYISLDKMSDEKTIYYIYETQQFKVNTLRDNAGRVIGLAFTEMEE